jgi:hypothetical protein
MELPINSMFNQTFVGLHSKETRHHVRILEIDGVYIASIITYRDKQFLQVIESAFDSMEDVREYLASQPYVEFPNDEQEKYDWRDYESY